jgi:hypothetical protein
MLEQPEPKHAPWDASGIHGMHQARQWDAVTTVDVPELHGERLGFVALTPDQLVVEEGSGDVTELAAALGRDLAPPYRAEAVRRDAALWVVGGRTIEIVHLPDVAGSEIELAMHDGERTLLVDGEPAFGSVPALERPGHVVRARRIAGDAWEIETHAL